MNFLNQIVEIAQKLITFRTTADNPTALNDSLKWIENYLFDTDLVIKRFERNQKPSLLILLSQESPQVLLNGHVDVVSAKDSQFEPMIRDGKIFGRGALDMKSGLAVLIVLMKHLSQQQIRLPIGLSIVTDEEIGGQNGTGYLTEQEGKPKFFLSAEPTDLQIGNEARGIIWLKIKTVGKAAHASSPWLGENANVKLVNLLKKLNELYPTPNNEEWVTTRNLSTIKGGETTNKVPDLAEATLDIRYIPSDNPDEIIREIRNIDPQSEVEIINKEPASYTDGGNEFIVKLKQSLKSSGVEPKLLKKFAASDARFYTRKNIPAVVFGPSGQGQHSDNEFVDVSSLEKLYNVLLDFILKYK